MKTACFTGHRPDKIGGYDSNNPLRKWVEYALDRSIFEAREKGIDLFLSGGALGVDQIAAGICDFHGFPFILVEPVDSFYSVWPIDAQKRYIALREQAADVVTLSPGPYKPQLMQARNEYMVNNSDVVIAVWNGSEGGTYNTVRYAETQGKPIYRINPDARTRGWLVGKL